MSFSIWFGATGRRLKQRRKDMAEKKAKGVEGMEVMASERLEPKDFITVTRTVPKEAGGTGEEEVKEELIEVRPFHSEPARVRIAKGLTMNLGDYRSARIDVDLTLPCYVEEVMGMIEKVNSIVEARLVMERNSIRESLKKRGKGGE